MMSIEQAARLSSEAEQEQEGRAHGDADTHGAASTLQVARYARSYAADFGQALSSDAALRSAVSAALRTSTVAERFAALSPELEELLSERHAFAAFRSAAGYQTWLTAPEAGVRALLRECLQLCEAPMLATVDAVHAGLLGAAATVQARLTGAPGGLELGADMLCDLEARAAAAIDAWRAETAGQLRRLLAAEAGFPPADAFAALRRELEVAGQVGGGLSRGVTQPVGKAVAELGEQEKEEWKSFFMGWLSKRNRHGRWQRRWFVVAPGEQHLYYFRGPEQAPARATIPLRGASLITDVLPLASSVKALKALQSGTAVESAAQPLLFQLQLEAGAEAGDASHPKRAVASITLRAESAAAKREWVRQLAQAITHAQPAAGAELKSGHRLRALAGQDSEEAEAAGGGSNSVSGPAQRKISTTVFPDGTKEGSPAAAEKGEELKGEAEAAAEDSAAAEDALVAAIAAQAAQAAEEISAAEAAVLGCVVGAVRGYVRDGHARLADLTGKVVAAGMLGRGEDLFSALLAALAPGQQRSALDWV